MPYALFPPRSPNPRHPSKDPLPKYTTSDPAVAQVFHSYGWPVLHVSLSSLPPMEDMEKSWETIATDEVEEDEQVEEEDDHVENGDDGVDEEEDDDEEDDDEEDEEEVPSITRLGGLMELHFSGIALQRWMFDGEQVDEEVKEDLMWMAGWMTDRVVDLRYVGL
ncbi:hypothetical protein GRF29_154g202537 [Pseudopithomyces chartarum]|uniref:Uncharacterized protein n=1 Tax=Pseudopithomyces chartarum TaxID=1892770 RepID=A0AAN6RD24_9PLEO|nr:hypothetical protein GRF29_154g202537 [Pseudopithomyces chartarum]